MIKEKPSQMGDLAERYRELAKRLKNYKNSPKGNNPNYFWDGFGLIHNRILTLAEILSEYYRKWNVFLEKNPSASDETITKDIFGRITTVTTWCFISIFAAIEFTIKNIIKDSVRNEFLQLKKDLTDGTHVYLEDVIKKSTASNLVASDDLPKWIALIELRNIFVHNNGYPDSDKLYEPIKKYFTCFKKNEMIMGPYDIFFTFTEMLVTLYESWSENYRDENTPKL